MYIFQVCNTKNLARPFLELVFTYVVIQNLLFHENNFMHQLSIAWAEFLVLNNGFKNATVSLETPCCAAFVHERTCDSDVAIAVDPGVGCILECPSTSPTRAAAVSSSLDVTAFRVNHAQPGKAFLAMYQKRARISRGLQQCCDVGFTRVVILKPSRGAAQGLHSLEP